MNTSNAFNTFMKGENLSKSIKLTDEETADVHQSVSEINGIKQSLKLKMCKAKVFRIGEKKEETMEESKKVYKESLKNKEGNVKDLNKVKLHLSKIGQIMFGGHPEGELGTSFQRFANSGALEKVEKSSEWQVIGRVKIKPPNSQSSEGKARVEKIYLDEFSAHRILKALPTLPSIC